MFPSPICPLLRGPLAGLLGLLVALPGPAAATPLGIAEAMRIAEREAPALLARQAQLRAAGEDAARADALPDPMLTLAIDNLTITGSNAGRLGADMMTMRRVGVMQDWPLPSKRQARRSAAEAGVIEADAELQAGRLQVRRAAALAWVAAWRAGTELALLDELEIEVARAAELIERRLAGGVGSAGEALLARAELAELGARRRALRADLDAARAELARWLGPAARRPLDKAPDFATLPRDAAALRASIDRHAELQPAEARVLRAERAVALARADTRPDLRFGAAYGARSGADDMLMLEVGVGLPLFRRDRQQRDIAARQAERDAAEAEHDDLRRRQRAALEAELARWAGLRSQAEHYRTQLLPLARDRGRLALAALHGGADLQAWLAAHHAEIELRLRYAAVLADLAGRWAWLSTLLPEDSP